MGEETNMKKKKSLFLTVAMLLVCTFLGAGSAYASIAQVQYDAVNMTNTIFEIDTGGIAHLTEEIIAKSTVTRITAEAYVQKRGFLGLYWTTVENNQPNNTWIDTVNDTHLMVNHYVYLSSSGTYRVCVKYTVETIDGMTEVINDERECVR